MILMLLCCKLRKTLLNIGYFQTPEHESLRNQMIAAWVHFKAFCKAQRIQCSQPRFRVRQVTNMQEAKPE